MWILSKKLFMINWLQNALESLCCRHDEICYTNLLWTSSCQNHVVYHITTWWSPWNEIWQWSRCHQPSVDELLSASSSSADNLSDSIIFWAPGWQERSFSESLWIWVILTQSKALSIKIDLNSHSKCDFYPHFHQQCHCSAAGQFRDIGCVSFDFFDNNPISSPQDRGAEELLYCKTLQCTFLSFKNIKRNCPRVNLRVWLRWLAAHDRLLWWRTPPPISWVQLTTPNAMSVKTVVLVMLFSDNVVVSPSCLKFSLFWWWRLIMMVKIMRCVCLRSFLRIQLTPAIHWLPYTNKRWPGQRFETNIGKNSSLSLKITVINPSWSSQPNWHPNSLQLQSNSPDREREKLLHAFTRSCYNQLSSAESASGWVGWRGESESGGLLRPPNLRTDTCFLFQ